MLNQFGMPTLGFIEVIFCGKICLIQTVGLHNIHAIIYCFHCDPRKCSLYGDHPTDWTTKKIVFRIQAGARHIMLSTSLHHAETLSGLIHFGTQLRDTVTKVNTLIGQFHVVTLRLTVV
jgi:hypothetical protein